MNFDPNNQMLRRLVGLRLLMNRPLTADDPPVSMDGETSAPDAPYNPFTPDDQLKQLVARTLLTGRPPSVDDLPPSKPLEISPAAAAASPPSDWSRLIATPSPPPNAEPRNFLAQSPSITSGDRIVVAPGTTTQMAPIAGAGATAIVNQVPATGFKWRGSTIYDYPDKSEDVAEGGTVAWRTNNPGNMVDGEFTRSHGAIGHYGDFAIFPNETTGSAALDALLNSPAYQAGTIDAAIAKFAPPDKNNSPAYQAFVSGHLRIPGSTQMSKLTSTQMRALADAIRTYEGWRPGKRTYLEGR